MKSEFFYSKTYRTILIGLLVLIAILAGILTYDVLEFRKFLPVATLDFTEDNWIKVNYARIYSNDQAISPNDQLTLLFNVTNKTPMRLNLEPKIYVDIGGEIVKKKEDFGSTQIGIKNTVVLPSYNFFAANEGQNNVKVSLTLSFFNGTIIKYENATTSFQVLSTGDKLLSNQNTMIMIGILVSILGSAFALSLTAYQTKLTRDEKNQTIRAWIGQKLGASFDPVRIYNEKGEIKTVEEWGKMTKIEMQNFNPSVYEHVMILKNFGQIPAFDVRPRFVCSLNPDRKELNKENWWEPGEIMPYDEAKYTLPIPVAYYEKAKTDHNFKFYMIFELKYRSGNLKDEKIYGFISEFIHGGITKISHWDEKRDYGKESGDVVFRSKN